MISVATSKALSVPKYAIYASMAGGLSTILIVGLLSGLVGRPNNCIPKTTLPTLSSSMSSSSLPSSTVTFPQSTTQTFSQTQAPSTSTTNRVTTSTVVTVTPQVTTRTTTTTTTTTTRTSTSTSTSTRPSTSTTSTSTTTSRTTTTTATTTGGVVTSTTTRPTSTSTTTRTSTSTATTTTTTTTRTSTSTATTSTSTTSTGSITRTIPTTISATTPEITVEEDTNFRLPSYILPKNYNLLLKTYFNPYDTFKQSNVTKNQWSRYFGEVEITLETKQTTNRIELHVNIGLNIDRSKTVLTQTSNNQIIALANQNYLPNDLYEFISENNFPAGEYKLKLFFDGITSFTGFYKADYLENETPRSLLATRFAPTLARTAFPCFDEPSYKAEFQITIEHPERSISVSNAPIQSTQTFTESGQQRVRTTFMKSPKMSTYLLAWAIIPDDFESKSVSTNGVEIRVHGRKSAIQNNLADFPLDVAKRVLEYYINAFSVNGAVPSKIDLIGLPGYPEASSPSWGLNAFHEDNLFYSEKINSFADKQIVAEIIAKEFAHYWFGNYVTCQWWDDLWLNEAFATFFQYKSINSIFPDWGVDNQFINDKMIPAMWEDGFADSRPIKMNITSTSDLNIAFEELIYSKGAALIRMLEGIIGEPELMNGLKAYLNSKPFGSVTTQDFFNSVTIPSNLNLGVNTQALIEPWLLQKNYPEVAVLLETVSGKTRVRFIQDRFLLSEIQQDNEATYRWRIHLQCRAGGEVNGAVINHLGGQVLEFSYLLQSENGIFDLDRRYTWVKCNTDFRGFYITDYANNIFDAFETVLMVNPDAFSIADRSNIIHNAFELAFLGSKSYQIPNYLANYLTEKETAVAPFKTFIWHINKVANIIEHRVSFKNLRGFISDMLNSVVSRLGLNIWEDSGDHQIRLLKADLVEFQCRMQIESCLNKATQLFESIPEDFFTKPNENQDLNPVPGNYRPVVLKYHLQNTYDFFDWIEVFGFAELTNNAREREYGFDALGNTRSSFLFDLYLSELLEDGTIIKVDDYLRVLNAVGQNPNGRYFAWYFVREYWYYLVFETTDPRGLTESIRKITDSFDNIFLLDEVLKFFADSYPFQTNDLRQKVLDTVTNNIFWVANKEFDFENFFFIISKNKKI